MKENLKEVLKECESAYRLYLLFLKDWIVAQEEGEPILRYVEFPFDELRAIEQRMILLSDLLEERRCEPVRRRRSWADFVLRAAERFSPDREGFVSVKLGLLFQSKDGAEEFIKKVSLDLPKVTNVRIEEESQFDSGNLVDVSGKLGPLNPRQVPSRLFDLVKNVNAVARSQGGDVKFIYLL